MAVTANSSNNIAQLSQVLDRNASPGQKWFSLQDNVLDGSYHPVDVGYATIIRNSDPVAYYRLNETAGSVSIIDSSNNTNHGKVISTVTLGQAGATADGDTSAYFGGGYIGVPEDSSLDISGNQLTVEAWIKVNNGSGGIIVNKENSYELAVQSNQLQLALATGGNMNGHAGWYWFGTQVVADGNWHHIVAVYDGTQVLLYVDGVVGYTEPNYSGNVHVATTNGLGIGARGINSAGTAGGTSLFTGSIDEVAIYAQALSANDITAHYNAGLNNKASLDEVGWWGSTLSASDGTFSTAQTLTIPYSRTISFNTLRLSGDSATNDYPVNFTVTLSKAGTTVKTVTVTGNVSINWSQALDKTYDADQMVISITKVNKGNRVAKILEASDLWQLARVDAGTLSSVDAHTLVALSLNSQDTGTLSAIDKHNPITVSNTRTDAGTLSASDSSFFTHLEKWTKDILVVTQAETKTVKNSFTRIDSGTLSDNESHTTTVKPTTRVDAGTLSVVENKTVTNRNTRTDTLTLTQVEKSSPAKVSFLRPDTLTLTQVESKSVKASFTRPDTLKLTQVETKAVTAKLYRNDSPTIKQAVEGDDVTAEFGSSDNLVVTSSDVSFMTNIHTVMDGDYRQTFAKVEISYTDPLVDGDVTITASTTANGTDPSETADTKESPDYKWFSLQENLLDGTYHPMSSDLSNSSVGWWGTVLSDSTGALNPSEWLQVDVTPRGVYELKVIGDSLLNEYPVDFDIVATDENGTQVLDRQVRGNTLCSYTETLTTPLVNITTMKLIIYKVNKPNRTAKILEFFANLVETYEGDDIISINLLEEQNFTDMTLPIGNVSSNELEVRLYNDNRKFDPDNDDSPLYGWLKKNRRIKAWLGAEVVPGQIEWYQLGVFWSQEWTSPDGDIYTSAVAYDRLESIRVTDFTTSQVYVNDNLYDMAVTVLRDAGLRDEEFVVDTRLQNTVIPYMWFGRVSHRDAIVQIAEAALGRVYCDRQGRIVVTPYIITDNAMYDFDYDKSIVDISRPVALGQITNSVEVTAQPRVLQNSSQVYMSTDSITLDPGEVYTETINFSDVPVMNAQAPVLTADAGITITSYTAYAWGMDITYTNSNSTSATVQQVTVDGQVLQVVGQRTAVAKDDKSIQDNGKQSYTMQNDFIQSYQTAQQIAQSILSTYSQLRHDANIQSRGNIALQLGDRVTIPTRKGTKIDHVITRQKLNWDGALDAEVDAQLLVVGG